MKKLFGYCIVSCFSFALITGCFGFMDDSDDKKISAPKNLQASDGTYVDKIELTWDCVDKAASYNVYVSESSNGSYTKINDSGITTCGSDGTGATYGTVFYYKVSAVDSKNNESELSEYNSGYLAYSSIKIANAMTSQDIVIEELYISSDNINPDDSNTWGTELLGYLGYNTIQPGYYLTIHFAPGTYDIFVRTELYDSYIWYVIRDNETFDIDEFNTLYWHTHNSYDYYTYDYGSKEIDTMKQIVK